MDHSTDQTWHAVSQRLDALALKLKLHLEQGGADLPAALDQFGRSLADAFTTLGDAVKDEAVRADVRETGRLVGEAVSDTVSQLRDDVRATFASKHR